MALLVFGIHELGAFEPDCGPSVEDCIVWSGGGTPEEVVEEQRDDHTRDTWLIILVGAGMSLIIPISFTVGVVKGLRQRRPSRARPFPDYLYDIEETDRRDGHWPG